MGVDPVTLALIQIAISVALTALAQALAPDIKNVGPRLDDLSPTAVQPGVPMQRCFSCTTAIGTVIAQTKLIETENEEEVGGKGFFGPSVSATTFTYSVHIAVAFSSRQIGAITRIKAAEKTIYERGVQKSQAEIDAEVAAFEAQAFSDAQTFYGSTSPTNPATGGSWTPTEVDALAASKASREGQWLRNDLEAANAQATKHYDQIEIFTGTEDQAPSSILEALEGVGEVPAYRGTAYFVLKSLQLADFGNRVPPFKIEVADLGPTALQVHTGPDTGTQAPNQSGQYLIDYDRGKWFAMGTGGGPWTYMIEFNLGTRTQTQIHDLTILTGDGGGAMDLRGIDRATGLLIGWHNYNPTGPENSNVRAYAYDPVSKTVVTNINYFEADFDQSPSDFETQHYPVIESANGSFKAALSTDFDSDVPALARNTITNIPAMTFNSRFTGPEEGTYEGSPSRPKWMTGSINAEFRSDTAWALWVSFDNIQFRSMTIGNTGVVTQTNYSSHNRTEFHATELFLKLALNWTPYYDSADDTLIAMIQTQPSGGGPIRHWVFKWQPATDTILWKTELPFMETVTTARGNTRIRDGFLVLYGDNFQDVQRIDTSNGQFTNELTAYGTDIELNSTSWDGVNGCLNSYFGNGTSFDVIRSFCWEVAVQCGISVADIIRDAMNDWTPDVSPLVEGDHFEIAPELETILVHGATWTRLMSASNVADLCQIWKPVGYFESGDRIKFVHRNSDLAATIRPQDMRQRAIGEEAAANVVTKRADDIGLPREVRIKFLDHNRLYSSNTAYARLKNSRSNLVTEQELPFAGTPAEAKFAAYMLMSEAFAARTQREFSLPLPYFILEQYDVIAVPGNDGSVQRSRLTTIEFGANMVLRMTAQDHVEALDIVFDAEGGVLTGVDFFRPIPSIMQALDTARLTDDETLDNGYKILVGLGAPSAGWKGGTVYRDTNSGSSPPAFGIDFGDPNDTNFVPVVDVIVSLDIGVVVQAANTAVDEFTVDNTLSMVVEFQTVNPVFSGLTDAQFETGFRNIFAVGNNVKGWEILQAKNVAMIDAQTFEFWTFHRGMRGTEWAISQMAPNDEVVHLTTASLNRDTFTQAQIGNVITYRGVSSGIDVVAAADYDLTVVGRQLILYAPTLGPVYRDGAGEITGTLEGRALQANDAGQFDLPTAEKDFDIVIFDGDPGGSPAPNEKRVISLTDTDAFTYTVAQQTTDFGSPQASVFATIYQKDADGARGYGRNVTI